jgi:hypothetical protein
MIRVFLLAAALPILLAAPAQAQRAGGDQPTLLGQFGDWGAYKAAPGGKTVCFALSKPTSAVIDPPTRKRDASYLFLSTRPSEKVKNEFSAIVGYPQKPGAETTVTVGSSNFAMYTQADGAWVKNAAEETQLIDAIRRGSEVTVRSESARAVDGKTAKTTDTYSLKGVAQALDKVAEECR